VKQKFCRCRPIKLISRHCTKVHCSVLENTWNLTKYYKNCCGINNGSLIKLTVTWNQSCFKGNNVFTMNSLLWRNYCPSSSEYQLHSFKEVHFTNCPRHYIFFLRPSTKKWTANAARGNGKVDDPCAKGCGNRCTPWALVVQNCQVEFISTQRLTSVMICDKCPS
jgi:hypothetical protein